jgi:membrane protein DedA with SNARE-associated domain
MTTDTPDGLASWALALLREHSELTAAVVFVLGFAESIALVSLFVPSTVLFLAIGAADGAAGGSFWPVWLAGAAGAALGDLVSYGLGRYFKFDVPRIWPFCRFPDLLPKSRAMFERWGLLAIAGGKFLGMLRPFIPVVAGMLDMPWLLFLLGSVLSSLMWAGVFLAPGYGLTLLWR